MEAKKRKLTNTSARNVNRIADKYGYRKMIVYVSGGRGFLSIFQPFLRSPYKSHLTSGMCTMEYLEKLTEEDI